MRYFSQTVCVLFKGSWVQGVRQSNSEVFSRNGARLSGRTGEAAFYNPLIFSSIPLLPSPMHGQAPEDIRVISLRDTHPQCSYTKRRSQIWAPDLCAEGLLLPGDQPLTGSFSLSLMVALISPQTFSPLLFVRFLCQVQHHMPSSKSQQAVAKGNNADIRRQVSSVLLSPLERV